MPRPDKGTRQKLIDTATDLIWTSGYGAVSVDDICRAAGVKKGSFYHYFPSKQDLALAVMEGHFESEVEPDLKRIFAANIPFRQQIETLADTILQNEREELEKYGRVCGCPFATLGSEMTGSEAQDIASKVEEVFGRCKSYMRRAIEAAVANGDLPKIDAARKTDETHDFFTGLMMMARVHNNLDGLERDLKAGLLRILLLEDRPLLQKKNF